MANPVLNNLTGNRGEGWGLDEGRVTLESVVNKAFITLGVLILTAIGSWVFASNAIANRDTEALQLVGSAAFVASITCLGLSFWISMRREPSAVLVLIFAALEGLVIGLFSKSAALYAGQNDVVVGAVAGTLVTAAVCFAVFKYGNVRVSSKGRRIIQIAMFSFVGVALVDLVFVLFGSGLGLGGFTALGAIFSAIGVVIAIFMLMDDFTAVEYAIDAGLPEKESWRLAFGLTVTLVWIYVNLLKILAYLRGGD